MEEKKGSSAEVRRVKRVEDVETGAVETRMNIGHEVSKCKVSKRGRESRGEEKEAKREGERICDPVAGKSSYESDSGPADDEAPVTVMGGADGRLSASPTSPGVVAGKLLPAKTGVAVVGVDPARV